MLADVLEKKKGGATSVASGRGGGLSDKGSARSISVDTAG